MNNLDALDLFEVHYEQRGLERMDLLVAVSAEAARSKFTKDIAPLLGETIKLIVVKPFNSKEDVL